MRSSNVRGCAFVLVVAAGVVGGVFAGRAHSEAPAKKGAGSGEKDAAARSEIKAVFRAQVDAWNRGDVDAFMEHYWKSDELTFSSRGRTTRGWQATLDGYRKRYPTREKMGRLTLDGLEITPLEGVAALVLGEWKLDRASEPIGGNFTLVLRKIDGRWVIVHDHTSRLEEG
jgi:beta-aspartyl-peptidase (threonine type)